MSRNSLRAGGDAAPLAAQPTRRWYSPSGALARRRCGRPSESGAGGRRGAGRPRQRAHLVAVAVHDGHRHLVGAPQPEREQRGVEAAVAVREKLRRNVSCSITGVERFSRVVTKNAPTVATTSAANTRAGQPPPAFLPPLLSLPTSTITSKEPAISAFTESTGPVSSIPSRFATARAAALPRLAVEHLGLRLVDPRGVADRAQLEAAGAHLLADLGREALHRGPVQHRHGHLRGIDVRAWRRSRRPASATASPPSLPARTCGSDAVSSRRRAAGSRRRRRPPAPARRGPRARCSACGMWMLRIRSRSGLRRRGRLSRAAWAERVRPAGRRRRGATSVPARPPSPARTAPRRARARARPLAQAAHVARLGEVEQRQDRQAQEGGQTDVRAYALDQLHATAARAPRRPCGRGPPASVPTAVNASRASSASACARYASSRSLHQPLDPLEHVLDPLGLERRARAQDAVRVRGNRPLAGAEQLLAQLLARPRADDLDRDLASGSCPESRIMLRARSMIFTCSPISSTNVSPPRAMLAGADHELDRLGNRHEVALHVGMRDRHRAALLDLARNSGTTLPLEPSTLPNRTQQKTVRSCGGRAPRRSTPPSPSRRPARWRD